MSTRFVIRVGRMTRRSPTWIASVLALGTSGAAFAQAKPDRPIVEAIGAAPDACFDGKSLAESIATWLGKPVIDPRISILVRRPIPESIRFTVEREQKLVGERDLAVGTLPCPDLRAAVSLAIAIAIDATLLDSLGIQPPITTPTERDTSLEEVPASPAPAPVATLTPPAIDRARPEKRATTRPATTHGLAVGIEATTLFSVLPGPALGASPRVGYGPAKWLDLRISALGTTRAQTVVGGGTASASLFAGRAETCVLGNLTEVRAGGCVGGSVGSYSAEGAGLAPAYSTSVRWAALSARAEARYPLHTSFALLVAVTGFVPVVRPELQVVDKQGQIVDTWRTPPVGFAVSVGGDLRLW